MITSVAASSCALRGSHRNQARDYGIPVCAADAERDLLSSKALQCWFAAPHGRWRVLGHQSHLEALVMDVEAQDLRDAGEIGRRVVDPVARAFSEVLVYVRAEPDGELVHIRRVRWTPKVGFETLDYSTSVADSPLTIRSGPPER